MAKEQEQDKAVNAWTQSEALLKERPVNIPHILALSRDRQGGRKWFEEL